MANKGPIKASRNTSHFTAILIVHFIWLTCSMHHSLWGLCRFVYHVLLLALLHDPRACSINLLESFFFFIDRFHLGVPNGKRVTVKPVLTNTLGECCSVCLIRGVRLIQVLIDNVIWGVKCHSNEQWKHLEYSQRLWQYTFALISLLKMIVPYP